MTTSPTYSTSSSAQAILQVSILSLADSLLSRGGQLDPQDLMMRFMAWWYMGYNNAFAAHPDGVGFHAGTALEASGTSLLVATREAR